MLQEISILTSAGGAGQQGPEVTGGDWEGHRWRLLMDPGKPFSWTLPVIFGGRGHKAKVNRQRMWSRYKEWPPCDTKDLTFGHLPGIGHQLELKAPVR
jgi:hypothetical protein